MTRKLLCRWWYTRKMLARQVASETNSSISCKSSCKFYHPTTIKDKYTQEYSRELGKCYCGSELITIISNRANDDSIFFRVCGRTRKSMLRCRN